MVFLKISQTSQGNTCVGVFFYKVTSLQPVSFVKRDSNTSAFLWSLQNFYEYLFWGISANKLPYCKRLLLKVFYKKAVLKKFRKLHRKVPVLQSFFMKLQVFSQQVFWKEIPIQVLSCLQNFAKFAKLLRIPILRNICKGLLLQVVYKKARS